MTTGLVYLRPKRVVRSRAYGPFHKAGPKAWAYLIEWLDRHGIRDEAGLGYGLACELPENVVDKRRRYDACILLPPSVEASQLEEMQFLDLPGGAYMRQRYVGRIEGLSEASRLFRDKEISEYGLCTDRARPLVEIYLDDPKNVAPDKLRVDLCLPVTVERVSAAA